MSLRRLALSYIVFFTVLGILGFGYHYLDDLARGFTGTLEDRLIEEMTGAYTAGLAIVPIVAFLTKRLTWGRTPWFAFVAGHLAGAVCYSAIHTTLMAFTRLALFRLLGLGIYDYGTMSFRYPMEFSNDVVAYGLATTLVYVWMRMRDGQRSALDAARLRTELVETRLSNLRLQLHPHFLFNALNAISAVMYEDPRTADTMLARLSDYLRMTLDASDRPEIALEDELQMTRSYVEIMRARFEQRLRLEISCEAGVERALVPSMLLQPLVENAIVHGGAGGAAGLGIDVTVSRDGDHLRIAIVDSGAGLPNGAGIVEGRGLAATRSRLEQRYGTSAQLGIANVAPGPGARVDVRLPFDAPVGAR